VAEKKAWLFTETFIGSNVWHQTPIDDIIDHDLDKNCLCGPTEIPESNGSILIAHFSLDNREGFVPDERTDIDKEAGNPE
jgi:hypothetical protein